MPHGAAGLCSVPPRVTMQPPVPPRRAERRANGDPRMDVELNALNERLAVAEERLAAFGRYL